MVFQVQIGELAHRLSTDRFFWLDIDGASAEELKTVTSVLQLLSRRVPSSRASDSGPGFEVDGQQIRISTFAPGVSGLPIEGHVLYARS